MHLFYDNKNIISIYAIGSLAHGGFSKYVSDIDVVVIFNNELSGLGGSFSKTSSPAPNIRFSFKALSRSISLIIPPLAVLIMMGCFLSFVFITNISIRFHIHEIQDIPDNIPLHLFSFETPILYKIDLIII